MSATAETLIRDLAERGVRLTRNVDRLRVEAAPGVVTHALRETLLARKAELLAALSAEPSRPCRTIVRFRLIGDVERAWASAIGAPSATRENIVADLRERLGDRVEFA